MSRKERKVISFENEEHDSLTGLFNRKSFEVISKYMTENETPVGVVMIDIDDFNRIGAEYGAETSDKVIQKTAQVLEEHIRDTDYAFRVNGDAFILLLCDVDSSKSEYILNKIHKIAKQLSSADDEVPAISFSCGLYFSACGVTAEDFCQTEAALNHTKCKGKSGCSLVDETGHLHYQRHEELHAQLKTPRIKIMERIQTGIWRIVLPENGEARRMYCDDSLLSILGVEEKSISPEECYEYWYNNVDPEYLSTVLETVRVISEKGSAEVSYPWNHPRQGVINIRCGGIMDDSYTDGKSIYGYYQNITNTTIVTKEDDSKYMVDALNDIFFCNFYINLESGQFTAYKQTESIRKKIGEQGNFSDMVKVILSDFAAEYNYDELKEFLTFDDLDDRVNKQSRVECEYALKENGEWRRARILPVRYDEAGRIQTFMLIISYIDNERRLERERRYHLAAIRAVNQKMFHSFQTFLGVIDVKTHMLEIIDNNETELPFYVESSYLYEYACEYGLKHTIVEEDRKKYLNAISIDAVRKSLAEKEQYEFTVNRIKPDGTTGLFAYHFCYFGNDTGKIICMAEDITSREETDLITEEVNMQGFLRHVKYIIKNIPDDYAMLHMDIKGFKAINDQIGYKRGNILLKKVIESIKNSELKPLVITRDMADHFYCLVRKENVDFKQITAMCEQKIAIENSSVMVSMYCGIYNIDDIDTEVRNMCDKARIAENALKSDESVCPYFVFTDKMKEEYIYRNDLIASLDEAVENKEFITFFQPIYDAKTEKIASAEALVRWIKSDGQVISPGVFIPTLEENGKISQIDMLAHNYVLDFVTERYTNRKFFVPISVNLSRMDFYNEDIMEQLLESVKKSRVPQQNLRFEITESAYAEIPEHGMNAIKMLREYGAKLLVDDFGQGYSSLGSLTQQRFDIVKLDMSFVRQIGKNPHAEAVISASIDMTHMMDAAVVAEGVETREQLEFLRDQGCDYIQGYYFSKPLEMKDFIELLDKENG